MQKYRRLTRSDRYRIEAGLSRKKSVQLISDQIGFHRSTVYRELNKGRIRKDTRTHKKGEYSAMAGNNYAKSIFHDTRIGCFYRGSKIKGWVQDQIEIKLSKGWSPEQISGRLKVEKGISISTEGIYKHIFSCKKRGGSLHEYLRNYKRRRKRFKQRNRYWELQKQRRKSIDDRPKGANNRTKSGHWERDLMLGKRSTGALLTAVDRKSHFTLLQKLKTTFAKEVNIKTSKAIMKSKLPCLTITNDNGHEFGEFWELESSLKVPIYFTHALCPWERGTVENTIGLLRQFIPKGSDLSKITNKELKDLEYTINSRPRKGLGFKTPIEVVTGKKQNLIKQKRIAPLSPEHYEQFYLTPKEISERNLRRETVALTG